MAGSFTYLGIHFVFSTKQRFPLIDQHIQSRLHSYIGGIIAELKGKPVEINSMPDHIHIFASMPKTISVSKFMEILKSNSSKWLRKTFSHLDCFAWQDGYGAFSVSPTGEDRVVQYIRRQQEHHRKMSFQEEFIAFLDSNGIDYDERYVWR